MAVGLEEPREVQPKDFSSTFRGFAAAAPIRSVLAYLNSDDFFVETPNYELLDRGLQYACPGAQVRIVVPCSAIGNMEFVWSNLLLVAPRYARHDFFLTPPETEADDRAPAIYDVSIFLGMIDPRVWLYNQLRSRLGPQEMPGRQVVTVETMEILHDPRFRDQARVIAADSDFDPRGRMAALAAIAHYRDPADLGFLLGRMDQEQTAEVAAAAAMAIGELGDPRVIPLLEAAKADAQSPVVRGAADAALKKLQRQQPGGDDQTNVPVPGMPANWSHLDALEDVASNFVDPRERARQALALQVWANNNP